MKSDLYTQKPLIIQKSYANKMFVTVCYYFSHYMLVQEMMRKDMGNMMLKEN